MFQKLKSWFPLRRQVIYTWLLYRRSIPIALSPKSALVFAPHQDDETLGCGGMIALKREQKIPVGVVFLTDGQSSYLKYPQVCPKELAQTRRQEAITALTMLGVERSEISFFNHPDGGLAKLPAAERQQTLDQLVQILQECQPQEVYVPYEQDVHPDHVVTYELVQEAVLKSQLPIEVLQYPVWTRWNPRELDFQSQQLASIYRLPINSVIDKKIEALKTYRSQYLPVLPDVEPILPPGFLKWFFSPYELFFR